MLHELTGNQKHCDSEASSSLTQQQQTISLSDWDLWQRVDFIQQLAMTSSVVGPRRSYKALSKTKLPPKTSHDQCLLVSDPLQLSESWQSHYIQECSANQWDAPKTAMCAANIGQQKGLNSFQQQCLTTHCITNTSKVEQIGLRSFASSAIFTWPLSNWVPLLQASQQFFFCRENTSTTSRMHKMRSKVHRILKHDFCATGINKLISHWQNYVDCNGSYFDE